VDEVHGKKEYHPNMIAIVKVIDYSNKTALVVPVGTVQHAEEGDFVFTTDGKIVKKTAVKLGKIYNGNAEVVSGNLKAGDKLITKGYQDLNENEKIRF